MHEIHILYELFLVFLTATAAVLVFHRLKIPYIVAFLVAGVIVGPFGFDIFTSTEDINVLAEIGVGLLLFTIGLEFSLTELQRIQRDVLLGGSMQVFVSLAAGTGVALSFGMPFHKALFLGQLIALSSTAIVLSLLAGRGEIDSPHGRMILGILLFQDLCVVPMMLITPLLGAQTGLKLIPILLSFGKALLLIAVLLVLAIFIVPRLLEIIVRVRLREVLVLGVVVIATGVAWSTSQLGLSLALGAFIAGLAISESPYSHQVTAEILPLKDVFNSLFFISIGMLLDVRFLLEHVGVLAAVVAATIVGKAVLASATTRFLSGSNALALITGVSVAQIGEFSFVLAKLGQEHELINPLLYQGFLVVAVVSMMLTPFSISGAHLVARRLPRSLAGKLRRQQEGGKERTDLHDHTIIVGFGLNGRYLARVLRESEIRYAVLEMNPQTVREARQSGEPIFFGDASRLELLRYVQIEKARILVITFADAALARRIIPVAKQANPGLSIIVRTKFAASVNELYLLGASMVIAEEFETVTEIFAHVLAGYNLPRSVIDSYVATIRREGPPMFRKAGMPLAAIEKLSVLLAECIVDNFLVFEGSPVVGRSLAELDFRRQTGTTVIAVVRNKTSLAPPPPELELAAGDLLVMMGNHKALDRVQDFVAGKERVV